MKDFFRELNYATSQALTGRFTDAIRSECTIPESLAKALDSGDWETLCSGSVAYHSRDHVIDIIGVRQIFAFYGKNLSIPLTVDRKRVALDKFLESEVKCATVNRNFSLWRRSGHPDRYVESVLFLAQQKIGSILGSSDVIDGSFPGLEELQFAFGPGANTNVKKNTSARWKLSSKPACSASMVNIVRDVLAEVPLMCDFWCDSSSETEWIVPVDIMPGELMFVAKNAKTDRTIIVEPSLNTLIQKGIGRYLKERLLKFGINLKDQHVGRQSNRRRAMFASITDDLMTVDLSSASDTIAKKLVESLLPFDWFELLNNSRSERIVSKEFGLDIQLEKFSSMGNGFTFELETLLFYSLTHAICIAEGITPDVSVYGDDIIAPKEIYAKMKYVFSEIGFTINDEKSYVSGPFRESCGGDYFLGQDVRPYYQKKNWSYADLYSFHNFLVRKGLHHIFPLLYGEVCNAIPTESKIFGPDGYGDGHLIGDWSPKRLKPKDGWGGYVFETRVQTALEIRRYLLPGDYLLPYYSAMVGSGGGNHFAVRGQTLRSRRIRVYTLSRQ